MGQGLLSRSVTYRWNTVDRAAYVRIPPPTSASPIGKGGVTQSQRESSLAKFWHHQSNMSFQCMLYSWTTWSKPKSFCLPFKVSLKYMPSVRTTSSKPESHDCSSRMSSLYISSLRSESSKLWSPCLCWSSRLCWLCPTLLISSISSSTSCWLRLT